VCNIEQSLVSKFAWLPAYSPVASFYPPMKACRRGFSSRSSLSVSSAREGCAVLNGPHSPRTLASPFAPGLSPISTAAWRSNCQCSAQP